MRMCSYRIVWFTSILLQCAHAQPDASEAGWESWDVVGEPVKEGKPNPEALSRDYAITQHLRNSGGQANFSVYTS